MVLLSVIKLLKLTVAAKTAINPINHSFYLKMFLSVIQHTANMI